MGENKSKSSTEEEQRKQAIAVAKSSTAAGDTSSELSSNEEDDEDNNQGNKEDERRVRRRVSENRHSSVSFAEPPMGSFTEHYDDDDDEENQNGNENPKEPPKKKFSRLETFSELRRRQSTAIKKQSKTLFQLRKSELVFVLFAGMLLSFNSGFMNGACLSGFLSETSDESGIQRYGVSAFTGTYTKSALSLAGTEIEGFGFAFSMILCFIAGSSLAGFINHHGVSFCLGPAYGPTFLLGSFLLVMSSILCRINPHGKGLFYLAAMANGLQNGMTSMYTGNLIRTTHLTGTSTDIGLFIGQILRGNYRNTWKLLILVGLAISFWSGSLVSWYATQKFRSYTLLLNAGLFFALGCSLVAFLIKTKNITILQGFFGTWNWEVSLEALESLHSNRALNDDGGEDSYGFFMQLFDRVDDDHSGYIEEDELMAALTEAGLSMSTRQMKGMFAHADNNGDGVISKQEWANIVEHHMKSSSSQRRDKKQNSHLNRQ